MKHHPSCKPSDKTLGFLCSHCGTFEPCDDPMQYTDDRLSIYRPEEDSAWAVDNYGDLIRVPFTLPSYYWQE